jgi:hypothetical protein
MVSFVQTLVAFLVGGAVTLLTQLILGGPPRQTGRAAAESWDGD